MQKRIYHAYDKVYLGAARTALARMLDFAVNELGRDLGPFFRLFIASGVAERFGTGDYEVLVGKSGVELAYEVLERSGEEPERVKPRFAYGRSEEYWCGWALAYYQWETALSFAQIEARVPVESVCALYAPYHEMDIRQFVDKMDELYLAAGTDTNLKRYRMRAGLSQRELAEISGVPLRTIQQYEQRQKSINKASFEYVLALAQALACRPEDLFEHVVPS